MEVKGHSNNVNLARFTTGNFDKGAGKIKIALWYMVNALFVRAGWNPFMGIKILLLRAFGAKIGKGLVIKNNVTIKSPWFLSIGNNVWLGEACWIDNLERVTIGNNVCISQGAMVLTGNHDYTISHFPYRNEAVTIDDGAWIGAKSVVCPGVHVNRNAVLSVGSIATKNMEPDTVYQGNPAMPIRRRVING